MSISGAVRMDIPEVNAYDVIKCERITPPCCDVVCGCNIIIDPQDMTSCSVDECLYISDYGRNNPAFSSDAAGTHIKM